MKIPFTTFGYTLFKYSKKHPCKSQNTKDNSLLIHSSYIYKTTLTNLKIPPTIFCLSPF